MAAADQCPHGPRKNSALLDQNADPAMTEQGDELPIIRKARPLSLANVESRPLSVEFQPATSKAGTTVTSLLKQHQKFKETWKLSAAYRNTCNLFNEALLQNQTMQITSCMCLCLGSISCEKDNGGFKYRNKSMSQLVAFESWVELLKENHTIEHIYVQDPKLNALDIEVLRSLGFSILDTPESDDYMSAKTFLFTPFGMPDVIVSAIDVAHPALHISTDLTTHRWWYRGAPDLGLHRSIPLEASLQRATLQPYLQQHVCRPMSQDFDDLKYLYWLPCHFIYYKPASRDDLVPVVFKKSDEELFTLDEARAMWENMYGGSRKGSRKKKAKRMLIKARTMLRKAMRVLKGGKRTKEASARSESSNNIESPSG